MPGPRFEVLPVVPILVHGQPPNDPVWGQRALQRLSRGVVLSFDRDCFLCAIHSA